MRQKLSIVLAFALVTSLMPILLFSGQSLVSAQGSNLNIGFERIGESPISVEFRATVQNLESEKLTLPLTILLDNLSFPIEDLEDVRMYVWDNDKFLENVPIYNKIPYENGWKWEFVGYKEENVWRFVKDTLKEWFFKGKKENMVADITIPSYDVDEGWGYGTKVFEIKINTGLKFREDENGWGSTGVMSWELNGVIYHDLTGSSWWDTNWTKQRPITITGEHPENYQIDIWENGDYKALKWDSDMRSDFGDIRFLENVTSGELNYLVENKVDGSAASVKVRRIENTQQDIDNVIWLYYGSPSATSESSVTGTYPLCSENFEAGFSTGWSFEKNSSAVTGGVFTDYYTEGSQSWGLYAPDDGANLWGSVKKNFDLTDIDNLKLWFYFWGTGYSAGYFRIYVDETLEFERYISEGGDTSFNETAFIDVSGYSGSTEVKIYMIKSRSGGYIWTKCRFDALRGWKVFSPEPTTEIGTETGSPNKPTSLLTEGQTNPQMLTTLTPEFSFNYSDNDDDNSSAARVQVGVSPDDNSMWDNSWDINVENGSTMTKTYAGSTLLRGVTYWWRVKAQDNVGAWSAWSDSANFKIALPVVENIWIVGENIVIDRDKDYTSDAVENITIWVQGYDNITDLEYAKCFVTVKDNEGNTLADNINISTTYDNIDENTAKWYYVFNPPDDSSCNFCLVEAVVEDENGLGSDNKKVENLFRIDDKLVVVTMDATQYEEINILITTKATTVSDGVAIENQQIVVTFYNPNGENRVELDGYTNENGEVSINKVLINEILGGWTVNARINVGENDNLDGMGSANFNLTGAVCRFVAVTPYDDKITGVISSRLENAAELHLMLKVYDIDSVLVVEKLEDYSVGGGEQFHWEIPYGVSLPEGTYSYSVRLWNYDYSAQYDSIFAEIRLTVAPTQQGLGDWVSVHTYEGRDGMFDVVLKRESTVTNSSLVDKSNFLFKEFIPAPSGSTVVVKVSGMPPTTLVVDQDGLITKNFDVEAGTTVMVDMEVTIASAVKIEALGETEVVAAVPRTVKEYEYKVTNLTGTTLRGVELTFPVSGVVGVVDDDGKPIEKFWEAGSTTVEIAVLEPYEEMTITLTATTMPSIDKVVDILIKWTIWGIPIIVFLLGGGIVLWVLTRSKAGPFSQVILMMLPTILVVFSLWMGWI